MLVIFYPDMRESFGSFLFFLFCSWYLRGICVCVQSKRFYLYFRIKTRTMEEYWDGGIKKGKRKKKKKVLKKFAPVM